MTSARDLLWILAIFHCGICGGAFSPCKPVPGKTRPTALLPLLAVEKKKAKTRPQGGNFFFAGVADADQVLQGGAPKNTASPSPSPSPSTLSPQNSKGDLVKNEFYLELLERFWSVGSEVARETFFALRRTAANALTASLPEHERQELLERTLGQDRVRAAQQQQQQRPAADDKYGPALSVQETAAAAGMEEALRNPKQVGEKEMADIYQQAERAAQERVETELAIQKARMEKERRQMAQEATIARERLQAEKQMLQTMQAEIAAEKEDLTSQQLAQQQEAFAAVQEKEEKLAAMEEALKQKEEQAKHDQETIEHLERKLKEQAAGTPPSVETKPRIHAGRYTPEEWRSLTDEEKDQVLAFRLEQGPIEFSEEASTTTLDVHPIMGPVIEDLGYKRIHIMSVGKLGTIPIWKKQRIYRHDRAKAMVDDKWKSMSLGLPGVICLQEGSDGKLSIIDGQHRVGMMLLLRNKQRKHLQDNPNDTSFQPIDFDRVLVEVYPSDRDDADVHAQNLFSEINKAEPVKLIDMPGVASAKDRKIIDEAVGMLYDAYPEMFSPSQRCHVPNVNIDNMRNALFGSDCLKTHKLTTSNKLYNWILEQNDMVGGKYEESKEEQSNINPSAWKKAQENKFYLGLDSRWLFN